MMDPIFMLHTQNQRMLENTQRSSDGLRTNMMRERKEKQGVRKHHHVEDTSFGTDFTDMGSDLDDMGDFLGGGGGAALFRQMWEEDVEEEERRAAQRSAETLFDEGQGHDLLNEPLGEREPQREEWPAPPEEEEEDSAAPPESEEERTEAEEPSPAPIEERVEEEAPPPADSPQEASPSPQEPAPKVEAPPPAQPAESAERVTVSKAESSAKEAVVKVPVPSSEPPPEAEEAPPALELKGVSSLLDNAQGFIFHEAVPEVIELSGRSSGRAAENLIEGIPHELEGVLDTLIYSKADPEVTGELRLLLSRFGQPILEACAQHGVQVHLLSQSELEARLRALSPQIPAQIALGQAAYLSSERQVLVAQELFPSHADYREPYAFQPALYYMAMAWDHIMGEEGFASLTSPVIKANAQACQVGLEGHSSPDALGCSNPVHYFAQSVEAYLSANDCREQSWNREDLYDFDRMMYDYVEYLYQRG